MNQEINKLVEFVAPTVELGVSQADLAAEITNLDNLGKLCESRMHVQVNQF